MSGPPQSLTLAQVTKLERLPEDSKVVGWCQLPRGPIVEFPDGKFRIVMPNGHLSEAASWVS